MDLLLSRANQQLQPYPTHHSEWMRFIFHFKIYCLCYELLSGFVLDTFPFSFLLITPPNSFILLLPYPQFKYYPLFLEVENVIILNFKSSESLRTFLSLILNIWDGPGPELDTNEARELATLSHWKQHNIERFK